MGRHSAPTALTRAAKRASAATSVVAAGAALTVGTGVAHAEVIPGSDAAGAQYAKILNQGTVGAINAINASAPVIGKVIGTWKGIPVVGTVVKVAQNASLGSTQSFDQIRISAPVFGSLYNQPIAYTGTSPDGPWGVYDRVIEYKGLFGDLRTVTGFSWGSSGGVGGAPFFELTRYVDPFGITSTAASGWAPTLNIGNGGFGLASGGAWVDGTVKNLLGGDAGFYGPFDVSLDNNGFKLAGPTIYGGPSIPGLGKVDFGLVTGQIAIDKSGKVVLVGPALTNEDWNGPASITSPGYGTVTGGFDTGGLELNGANSKLTAPKASVSAESNDLAPVGKINVGGSFDGGTVDRTGVTGTTGSVTGGTTTTKTTSNTDNTDPTEPVTTTKTTETNNQLTLSGTGSSSSVPVVSGNSTTTTTTTGTETTGTGDDAVTKNLPTEKTVTSDTVRSDGTTSHTTTP
ncbi:hypothetical protein [Tsukamurella sp. NPDC003166]|uniref:hypothetical protein n=1 Tax=Tsukamurella sp. NPDC003166 TaxID=3154444 RepID=UPI0033B01927